MTDIRDIYKTQFDGREYAKMYLIGDDYEKKWLIEDFYHEQFTKGILSGKTEGKTLLEIGCGPAFRSAMTASGHVTDIYLADLVENNRQLVKKWLKNEPDALDYSIMFDHVAKLEGKSDGKYLEDRVRKSVKDVIECDILSDNPINPMREFDIVTSSHCFDSFPDFSDYKKVWKNVYALLRPGGVVLVVGGIGGVSYMVGDKKLPIINASAESIKSAITESGLKIVEFEEFMYELPDLVVFKGSFVVVAIKE